MENKKVRLTNRSNGTVCYKIPELNNIRRQFSPREVKVVSVEELTALSYQPGGSALLYHYFLIEDPDVLHEVLNVKEEPEYWLEESKIPSWMQTCSLDEFIDALNFAPQGIKDLIKKYAVEVPLKDLEKLDKIKEILEYNALAAIENKKADQEEEKQQAARLAESSIQIPQPEIVAPPVTRKTAPTYKVVKKSD